MRKGLDVGQPHVTLLSLVGAGVVAVLAGAAVVGFGVSTFGVAILLGVLAAGLLALDSP